MATRPDRTAAIVLAGGGSTRFGSDKTRARLGGSTLLERVLDTAAPLVDDLVVVGPWAPPGRDRVLEAERLQGPLRGLVEGLRHVEAEHALVLGADHPFLQPALLGALLERRGEGDAVVPVGPEGPEPLVACYRTGVLGRAEQLLADGRRSMRALLGEVRTRWLGEAEWRPADPEGRSFLDVDRSSDLERWAGRTSGAEVTPERDQLELAAGEDLEHRGR